MRRRFAAWLVCGPLGHLWAGVADWIELLARAGRSTGASGRVSGPGDRVPGAEVRGRKAD
jgi:hypothetical protein